MWPQAASGVTFEGVQAVQSGSPYSISWNGSYRFASKVYYAAVTNAGVSINFVYY